MCVLKIQLVVLVLLAASAPAVTSKVTRHNTSQDFAAGKAENVIIGSKGTLQLGRESIDLAVDFNDVWSINSIVTIGSKVYLGTSPNGGVYEYSDGKLNQVYLAQKPNCPPDKTDPNDPNEKGETVDTNEHLANEHIFAMAADRSGQLLVAISGKRCALTRLVNGDLQTVYEPNDAKYIFATAVSKDGTIYLGTGPEGKIYSVNSDGTDAKVLYDSTDKNVLSLALTKDDSLLAGTDTRGLVYKIDINSGTTRVLYDSDNPEVTALLVTENQDVYAASTSAEVVKAQKKFGRELPLPGRPEDKSKPKGQGADKSSLKLNVANTTADNKGKDKSGKSAGKRPSKPGRASQVYKITTEGFVTEVFSAPAVLFTLAAREGKLLLGTGNEAELFSIDPESETSAVVYKDQKASQITATAVHGDIVYLGTANPAKLIKVTGSYNDQGTYISDLIDASQPANWGKLQIEADIPSGCKVAVESRSGNVKDVNDPTFSEWTKPQQITGPIQLKCPLGRYSHYKLTLNTSEPDKTPVIREVILASTVPNLAPRLTEVTAEPVGKPEKKGFFEIKYKAQDDNADTLVYKIDFRKLGRSKWIELEEKIDKPVYEWDGRTVEDGRYEIRVTADDAASNSAATAMSGRRISDPVVVDNTGPVITFGSMSNSNGDSLAWPIEIHGDNTQIDLTVTDQLSAIGKVQYTIDSNSEWKSAIPDDLVYDTTDETFSILFDELKSGEHVIAVKAEDAIGNVTYKTLELHIIAQ